MTRPNQVVRTSKHRSQACLGLWLEKNVFAYAAAATAAGAGMLFSAPLAESKIVYTPAHVNLQNRSSFPLDLDHNGIIDFYLVRHFAKSSMSTSQSVMSVCHVPATSLGLRCSTAASATNALNAVRAVAASTSRHSFAAAALVKGAKIQRGNRFLNKVPVFMGEKKFYFGTNGSTGSAWFGPWMNKGKGVRNRYLGLKFKINGKFHFGWVRLTITTPQKKAEFTATLTGYAYETIPNKGIVAGQTKGPDQSDDRAPTLTLTAPPHTPATLGLLALGTPALTIWRRQKIFAGAFRV